MSISRLRGGGGFLNIRFPTSPRGRSDRSQRKFTARRKTLPGFPWMGKFETTDQIAEYFGGNLIECLECGRCFRRLGCHLPRVHGLTMDQYREKYGLPWRRGLTSAASSQSYSDAMAARLADDDERRRLVERAAVARLKLQPGRNRKLAPALRVERAARVCGKQQKAYFTRAHADEMLRRVADGRTLRDVTKDADMPKMSWWHEWARENSGYRERYRAIVETLPFPVQARAEMLGDRFRQAVIELCADGLTNKEIGGRLGVHYQTVRVVTASIDAARRLGTTA